MPYPLSPELTRIRDCLRDGARLTLPQAVALEPTARYNTVWHRLTTWADEGVLQIVGHEPASRGGRARAIFAWGKGEAAQRPKGRTNRERIDYWRENEPDRYAAYLKYKREHAGRIRHARSVWRNMQRIDPVLSALLGVRT
jgi:hypothetical protein